MAKESIHQKRESKKKRIVTERPLGVRDLGSVEQYNKTQDLVTLAQDRVLLGNEVALQGMNVLLEYLRDALPEYARYLQNDLGKGVVFEVFKENLRYQRKVLHAQEKKEKHQPHQEHWQKMGTDYVRAVIYDRNLDGRIRTFLPIATEEGLSGTSGVPNFLQRGERRMVTATRALLAHQLK